MIQSIIPDGRDFETDMLAVRLAGEISYTDDKAQRAAKGFVGSEGQVVWLIPVLPIATSSL